MQTLGFNTVPPTVMHVDINSCFATVEQQANPFLRGKPVAVAAYDSPGGCILAPSIEAKTYGVQTGMRVFEGKRLCPGLLVLPPDPNKYRDVHLKLRKIFAFYTGDFLPKSIDEFVLELGGYPCLQNKTMQEVGKEIKKRIKKEVGDFMSVSVGIGPNRFLAKTASNLKKPNGLETIDKNNFEEVFAKLKITDLTGIKTGYGRRLWVHGIYTALDLYQAPLSKLRIAFKSVNSYYWYLRIRGWEIDNVEFGRRSYGNSYALPKPTLGLKQALPVLAKLTEKASFRLRQAGLLAHGVFLFVSFRDGTYFSRATTFDEQLFAASDILKKVKTIFAKAPQRPVRNIAVSCFGLKDLDSLQLKLFEDVVKKQALSNAIDKMNEDYGFFTVTTAQIAGTEKLIPDRISFGQPADVTHQALQAGGVKEIESFLGM